MPGRKLIEEAAYAPERIAVLCQAYDEARGKLAPRFGVQCANEISVKLAGIILMLARTSFDGPEELRDRAVNILLRDGA